MLLGILRLLTNMEYDLVTLDLTHIMIEKIKNKNKNVLFSQNYMDLGPILAWFLVLLHGTYYVLCYFSAIH